MPRAIPLASEDNGMFLESGDGVKLWTRITGRDNPDALLFINSLGCDLSMWDAQAGALADRFCIIRYDTRGHGRSGVPDEEYDIADLGLDVLSMLDVAGFDRVHVCGISLGGITAQWLAVHAPERIKGLVLANTAARIGTVETWQARIDSVLAQGMNAIAEAAIGRFFSEAFRAAQPDTAETFRTILRLTSPTGYAHCCAALRDADLRNALPRITAPTLVIGGRLDVSTPPAEAEYLARHIDGAHLVVLDTAHLSNVEQPAAFTAAVRQHLETADG